MRTVLGVGLGVAVVAVVVLLARNPTPRAVGRTDSSPYFAAPPAAVKARDLAVKKVEDKTAAVKIAVVPRLRMVWAFGKGASDAPGDCRFAPVQVKALTKVRAIEAGTPSWAVLADGRLKHWDWPAGEKERRSEALAKLRQVRDVCAISASSGWLLGLKTDGAVWAWGRGAKGGLEAEKLGGGKDEPVQIPALAKALQVASGPEHALVLSADGTVWAWGHGHNGELGLGSLADQPTPMQVPGIDGVAFVAAGDYMSYAVKGDGAVWAWGANYAGQLGLGSSDRQVKTPVLLTALTDVAAIASSSVGLALRRDGSVWTWGGNWAGQCGDGTTERRGTPAQVKGLDNVVAVAAGQEHCLALKKDGTVWAWGGNKCGQIGQPPAVEKELTPVQVSGLSHVAAISARGFQSLALVVGEEPDETPPDRAGP